jgi:hypothetical protein
VGINLHQYRWLGGKWQFDPGGGGVLTSSSAPSGAKALTFLLFCGTAKQLAEKVGVATEAFAAAKAGYSFRSLSGTTKGHALLQGPSQKHFSASSQAVPFQGKNKLGHYPSGKRDRSSLRSIRARRAGEARLRRAIDAFCTAHRIRRLS